MSRKKILVVDDEQSIRHSLEGILSDEGYEVVTAPDGMSAIRYLQVSQESFPDAVLLDIWMPHFDGIETLKQIKAEFSDLIVVMMSGHGTIETAVRATKLGAFDFIEKPLSIERLLVVLHNAENFQNLTRENNALRKQVQQRRALIGKSSAVRNVYDMIQKVAPTTGSVLILGENGTGKELVAHQIHALSPRYSKPMVEVNCAAIPEEMIESELFGEEKINSDGHFSIKRGKFDLAHGGTLFLDEIADMSSKTQSKILRIIEEKKFERIGGLTSIVVDVRLIAATNKDLKVEIEKGNFREDLYHRLNVVPLVLPSLRNRKDDCSVLAEHFLKEFSVTHGKLYRPLTEEAVRILEAYSWPGNVRELKNLMERIVILTTEIENGKAISADLLLSHLKNEIGHINPGESSLKSTATTDSTSESMAHYLSGSLKDARQNFEREYILKVLKENHWNVSKVAQLLGVERSNLHKKIKSYGLDSAETEPEK